MPSREKSVINAKTVLKFICLRLSIHIYINNMWKTEDVDSVMRNGLAKKIAAVLVSIIMVLCGLGVGGFTSEAEETYNEYVFENASIVGNVLTFNVGGTTVTVEVSSENASDFVWGVNGSNPMIRIVVGNEPDVSFTLDSSFNSATMGVFITTGSGSMPLAVNDSKFALGESFAGQHIYLQTLGGGNPGQGGGDPGQGGGNIQSTVKHTTNLRDNEHPAIEISVNDNHPNLDNDKALTDQGTTVSYRDSGDKVRIGIHCLFIYVPTYIKINGTEWLTDAPSNEELLNHYSEQRYHFYYDVDKAETYTISTRAKAADATNTPIGNFLWNYDHPESDDYVSHARLEVVSVEYKGETIYTAGSGDQANYGGAQEWDNDTTDGYGDRIGSATLPAGAIVTMRLIPEYGYQLVNFGVNNGNFDAQETPCVYTFTVAPGNFHLFARFEPVENEVDADSTNVVSGGSVVLNGAESSMEAGTARLDVSDANLEPAQISGFEGAAAGYRVTNYLDISLFNTIYQGSEAESWDTQVHNLDNSATITLQLAAGVDGDEVVIVHEVSPGVYETIPTVYDPVARTITFTTRGFSNYAIASRTVETTDNSNSSEGLPTRAPKTGYPEFPAMAVISALFGAVLVSYGIKKGRITG